MSDKEKHRPRLHPSVSALQHGPSVSQKKRYRRPWIRFFLRDFVDDTRLKSCSRDARSYWMDCLRIMHEAEPYGFLAVEGIFVSERQLAITTGEPARKVRKWLTELKRSGVYSVTGEQMPDDVRCLIPEGVPDGAIFSRRMLRDNYKRDQRKMAGS
jgi:hypothetical protein